MHMMKFMDQLYEWSDLIDLSIEVFDSHQMKPVPRDGKTLGEVMFKGNIVMKGYLKNSTATKIAMKDGWFQFIPMDISS